MGAYNARTDRHRNPAAFTTDVARTGGLIEGTDFIQGDPFMVPTTMGQRTYYTAHLLGDPVALSIQVIDKAGWQTKTGQPRWTYMDLPNEIWAKLEPQDKARIVGLMYHHEGGTEMAGLFI